MCNLKKCIKSALRFTLVAMLFIATLFVPSLHNLFGNEKVDAAEIGRIAGTSRYDTAVSISNIGWENVENVVLANGLNFPDALSGAPLAYALDAPILLVKKDTIPQATLDEISRLAPKNIYLLGSTGAISNTLASQLREKGYEITRVAGSSRYATAAAIGKELRKTNSHSTAVLVDGRNYPDALGIGGVASENGWPILFTTSDTLHEDTIQSLKDWDIKEVKIIGGKIAIKDTVADELTSMGIKIERISGASRLETSIKIAERFHTAPEEVMISTGYNFPDALSGGPLAAKLKSPILLVRPDRTTQNVLDYLGTTSPQNIYILGGSVAVNDDVKKEISSLYIGNSVGNILNGGIAAIEGDWIYSINFDAIYKSKIDGTHKTKIIDVSAEYINVVGDWIYYVNTGDKRSIYKIKIDGTGKTKLTENSGAYVHVVNGWIYYIDYHFESLGIYKVKTDGTSLTKIVDGYSWELKVADGWIYFGKEDGSGVKMHKMKVDGTNLQEIATEIHTYTNVVGDWIYYSEGQNIYKMNTNGQNKTIVANVYAGRLNVSGDWIYFRNNNDNQTIYKVKTDGSNLSKVGDDVGAYEINVVGDWIYYKKGVAEGTHLYRIKTDGTKKEFIAKSLSW